MLSRRDFRYRQWEGLEVADRVKFIYFLDVFMSRESMLTVGRGGHA